MVPVLRRADNVKRYGLNKANSAVLRLDSVIDEANKYVDQYLPGTVPEEYHGDAVHNLTRCFKIIKLSFVSSFYSARTSNLFEYTLCVLSAKIKIKAHAP
jgi:hypothetical protein